MGHNTSEDWASGEFEMLDPGDGAPITMGRLGVAVLGIVTAGSETNTLPDPTGLGYQLTIQHRDDGGQRVITAATAINEANDTTITLTDVDEAIGLVSVFNGLTGGYRWQVAWNNGTTLG